MTDELICASCWMPIKEDEARMQPYPPNGQWVHDEDGDDGCRGRYWDPPVTPSDLEGDR